MSDTTNAFVVILDEDVSEEESAKMVEAFLRFRGVIGVEPHTYEIADLIATQRARHKLAGSVYAFLKDWK